MAGYSCSVSKTYLLSRSETTNNMKSLLADAKARYIERYNMLRVAKIVDTNDDLVAIVGSNFDILCYKDVIQYIYDEFYKNSVSISERRQIKRVVTNLYNMYDEQYAWKYSKKKDLLESLEPEGYSFDYSHLKPKQGSSLYI